MSSRSTPILSICVPTYNRAHYLKDCLESISIQLKDNPHLQDAVHVIISDNCSSDNTQEVSESFRSSFRHFTYSRHKTNLGFDANIINVVKHATGTYCWYMADDDVIVNGGIDLVVKILEKDEYDIVTVESHPFTDKDFRLRQNFTGEHVFETHNPDDFFHKNTSIGGVSNLIFSKALWMECLDINDYLEHWLYYETVLKTFIKTRKKMIDVRHILVYTGQDCRWAENGTELFTFINSNLLLERMVSFGFDKNKINRALHKNRKRIPLIILRAKGHGLKCNMNNLNYMYKNLEEVGPLYLSFATILYFIPNFIIVIARDVRKSIFGPLHFSK